MTKRSLLIHSLTISLTLAVGSLPAILAQTQSPSTQPSKTTKSAATQKSTDAAATEEPSADQVMRELLLKRKTPPVIAPTRRPNVEPKKANIPSMPAATVNIDPSVLGVAPGEDLPPLLHDGTVVVNRRGRLRRTPEGYQVFIFEADDLNKPERPLIMQPCKKLENMEEMVQELGDRVIFTVSGQVQLYRDNNYLLPTMFKVDYERNNLSN